MFQLGDWRALCYTKPMIQRTKAELLADVTRILTIWWERLSLDREWFLTVGLDGLKDPRSYAETDWAENYRNATVLFNYERCRSFDADRLEQMCLHEIGHLYHADLHDCIFLNIGDSGLAGAAIFRELEKVVDRWANNMLHIYGRIEDDQKNADVSAASGGIEGAPPNSPQVDTAGSTCPVPLPKRLPDWRDSMVRDRGNWE